MTRVDRAAKNDGVDAVEVVNRVRLPEVDVVPGIREVLGDDAGDLSGCAMVADCRDEDSDSGPLRVRFVW
jgi:hypothetical protein